MNDMNDNLLSDIESDIDSDWKNIQKEILKKENDEKKKEISKMRYVSIDRNLPQIDIKYAGRMLYENMNDKEIWKMFCSSRGYDFKEVTCIKCHTLHTIFYQEKRYSSFNREYDYYESRYYNVVRDYIRIFCPNCSEILLNMTGCYLIGVIQIPKTKQEERRYESKF